MLSAFTQSEISMTQLLYRNGASDLVIEHRLKTIALLCSIDMFTKYMNEKEGGNYVDRMVQRSAVYGKHTRRVNL